MHRMWDSNPRPSDYKLRAWTTTPQCSHKTLMLHGTCLLFTSNRLKIKLIKWTKTEMGKWKENKHNFWQRMWLEFSGTQRTRRCLGRVVEDKKGRERGKRDSLGVGRGKEARLPLGLIWVIVTRICQWRGKRQLRNQWLTNANHKQPLGIKAALGSDWTEEGRSSSSVTSLVQFSHYKEITNQ